MLEVCRVVLLSAHLLLVDVAMAAPLVCVWLEWRETRRNDTTAGVIGRSLARSVGWVLAGGMVLGILLLALHWLLDDRQYFVALTSIPRSRLWFAVAELLFSFGCISAYAGLGNLWRNHRFAHRVIAVAGSANLMLHFPALFAIISVLDTRAALSGQVLDRAGYQRLLLDGEVVARVIHVWLAAFAVAGVALMGLAARSAELFSQADRDRLVRRAATLGMVPTLLQIPAGLWLALQMPEESRQPLFGGDWLATGLLLVSIVLALQLILALSSVALGDREPKQVWRSIVMMLVLVLLMVGARTRLETL